jgi:hypothetical protein
MQAAHRVDRAMCRVSLTSSTTAVHHRPLHDLRYRRAVPSLVPAQALAHAMDQAPRRRTCRWPVRTSFYHASALVVDEYVRWEAGALVTHPLFVCTSVCVLAVPSSSHLSDFSPRRWHLSSSCTVHTTQFVVRKAAFLVRLAALRGPLPGAGATPWVLTAPGPGVT